MNFELLPILNHYAYTVQIWALSGLKYSSFGPLKTFLFLVVSKMATITKNRNVFKWPKLLYFKPESAQI
jgi:hypothetical protein